MVCPIYKRQDRKICSNYKGISVLNICYKLFTKCLLIEVIGEYQGGFQADKPTSDNIFVLRNMRKRFLNTSSIYNNNVSILFIDFKKP